MPLLEHDHSRVLTPHLREFSVREVENGFVPKRLGTEFHYLREIDSTNNYARSLAERGAPEGAVVLAERQTQGRGRLGRGWVSPPYVNLYCSIILRPAIAPSRAPQITLTAAVALADVLESFSPVTPAIKWPNDILVGEKKLAGMLTEAVSNASGIEFVILGIGVNVNFSQAAMPPDIRYRATSLSHLAGKTISRETLLRRLIHSLDRCYGILQEAGFAAIAPRWEARFGLRNRTVRIETTDRAIIGRAIGLDTDGALIVESAEGGRQRIVAGDVIPVQA